MFLPDFVECLVDLLSVPCLRSVYFLLGILQTFPRKYLKTFCNHFCAKVNLTCMMYCKFLLNLCHILLLAYTSRTRKISKDQEIFVISNFAGTLFSPGYEL